MNNTKQIISGIIPAAGRATRLGKLPFSKELFPIGIDKSQTKVVSSHLLESMIIANVDQLHVVIRDGKWDIPAYYGSKFNHKPVCYHLAEYSYGVPFTVNQTSPFTKDHITLLGFPDILFEPKDAYRKLIDELQQSDVPVALGLFPVTKPQKWDMVTLDEDNQVKKIVIKPKSGVYKFGWVIAAWKPEFTAHLNKFVQDLITENTDAELLKNELHFGSAIISAMESGMKVKGVIFENGKCLDTGTPDEMKLAHDFY